MRLIQYVFFAIAGAAVGVWVYQFISLKFEQHEYYVVTDEEKAAAADYIKGKITPTVENWEWQTFYPEEGVNLRTGFVKDSASKGVVVVVPGFTGTIELVMREINLIHQAGYSVASIEYRGQGDSWRPLSNPEKGYVQSYDVLANDLAKFIESVREPDKPLFLYSISKGGHITLRMATENMSEVDAYALVVPLVKLYGGSLGYDTATRVAKLMTAIGLGEVYAPGQSTWPVGELVFGKAGPCNSNAELAQTQSALFAQHENLRTSGVTYKWIKEAAVSSDTLLEKSSVEPINRPMLMITAGIDELVDTQASQQFCTKQSDCRNLHFADSRHCITREDFEVYDGIIQSAIKHFDQQLINSNSSG